MSVRSAIIASNRFFDIRYTRVAGDGAKWLNAEISCGYALGGYGLNVDILYGRRHPAYRMPGLYLRVSRHGSCHNRPKFAINT